MVGAWYYRYVVQCAGHPATAALAMTMVVMINTYMMVTTLLLCLWPLSIVECTRCSLPWIAASVGWPSLPVLPVARQLVARARPPLCQPPPPWALHGVCCGPVSSCSSHPAKTRAIPSTCDLLPLIKNTRQPTQCQAAHAL
jgi:hypothetical protein